jgi:hypothetical protein
MRLREHPKIPWPPVWSEGSVRAEDGILKDVDIIEPNRLLLSNEIDGKVYFAEIWCSNMAFASRLEQKMKSNVGKPMREIGELEIGS